MKVLIGCEESGVVTRAFRERGHEAYSCDLLPTRGNPDWHFQEDVMVMVASRRWDIIILHPPCTSLAVSGNRWYGRGMPRHEERGQALDWTLRLWDAAKSFSHHTAMENPVSVLFRHVSEDVQYIQPWWFGHGETKKTGLALYNLPRLMPTDRVEGREARVHRMPPGPNRSRDRSATYPGIAEAMAEQWGSLEQQGATDGE